MKKLLTVLALSTAMIAPAFAQHGHGHHFQRHSGYHRNFNNWFVPALVTGAVVYGITRESQPPVVIQQPPVYVQPPVVIEQPPSHYGYNQRCTPWTETQNADGTITRQRQCY